MHRWCSCYVVSTSGFAALIRREVPNVNVTHCMLHRHAITSKTLPTFLKEVFDSVVKIVNYILARASNNRIFKEFCKEIGSDHEVLLYHTEVRWLSRGQILKHLLEMKMEVAVFLTEREHSLANKFENENFVLALACFADIFGHLNQANLCIHGPAVYIMDTTEMLQTLLNKFPLYIRRLQSGNFSDVGKRIVAR